MKGYLHKTEKGWFVIYDQILGEGIVKRNQNALPLHPLDIKQIDEDAKVFDNIEMRIKAYPVVEFEIVTKLVFDKISLSSIEVPVYAKLISTDSKKDRTCNHTNCIEICPECKLPSDILKNVISSQPDWNEEPLNYYGEDFGKDCEAVKNWDSFVEKKNNELEVEKLAEISSELQEATYTLQHKTTYKHGFIDGFNKAKETFYTKQDLIDLVECLKNYTKESHTILGHDDREPIEFVDIFLQEISDEEALNLAKELNKQPMKFSQTEISDEEIAQEFKNYNENWEIRQALEEGAKWYKKQIKK